MKTLIVIPARFASTRYPGKPLARLRGATGEARTLVRRSWEAANRASGISRVVVATDDEKIANEVKSFGGEVVMTSEDCANGTERCADAHARLGNAYDIVVNLQGDAPLTPHWFVEDLVAALAGSGAETGVATPVLRCDAAALGGFLEDRRQGRVGGTTAVFDRNGRALYFSKEVVPFSPQVPTHGAEIPVFHHVGVYAYRAAALAAYPGLASGPLERAEGLEQLRFMENGLAVKCVEVDARGRAFWELNNPEDIVRIEIMLGEMGME